MLALQAEVGSPTPRDTLPRCQKSSRAAALTQRPFITPSPARKSIWASAGFLIANVEGTSRNAKKQAGLRSPMPPSSFVPEFVFLVDRFGFAIGTVALH